MTEFGPRDDGEPHRPGAWTGVRGTGYPVDVSLDRSSRSLLALLVGGPVVWISHFMLVYLTAEAACTGEGRGLDLFDPPVLEVLTLVATAVAAAGCAAIAFVAHRRWRVAAAGRDALREDPARALAFAGWLLALLSLAAVLLVGLPVVVVTTC